MPETSRRNRKPEPKCTKGIKRQENTHPRRETETDRHTDTQTQAGGEEPPLTFLPQLHGIRSSPHAGGRCSCSFCCMSFCTCDQISFDTDASPCVRPELRPLLPLLDPTQDTGSWRTRPSDHTPFAKQQHTNLRPPRSLFSQEGRVYCRLGTRVGDRTRTVRMNYRARQLRR